jgi:tetratricopeptide (TPR) repeat protein
VDPLTRLVLGTTIADVQRSVGETQVAFDLVKRLTEAVKISGDLFGPDVVRAWHLRADLELQLQAAQQSRRSLKEARRIISSIPAGLTRTRLEIEQSLAEISIKESQGKLGETRAELREVSEDADRLLPLDDALAVKAMQRYASSLIMAGNHEAEAMRIATSIGARLPDLDRSIQGRTVLNLMVRAAQNLSEFKVATRYARRVLSSTLLLYGPKHRLAASAYDQLARMQSNLEGQREDAEENFQAGLKILRDLPPGTVRRQLMLQLNNHANFLRKRPETVELAERQAREALVLAEQLLPLGHLTRSAVEGTIAEVLVMRGKFREAHERLQRIDQALAEAEAREGKMLVLRAYLRVVYAQAKYGLGDKEGASKLLNLAWERYAPVDLASKLGIALDPGPAYDVLDFLEGTQKRK